MNDVEFQAFQRAARTLRALGRPMIGRLQIIAAAGDRGLKPHTIASGAKLGAWTRALKRLALWGLVVDQGWRWELSTEGARVCAQASIPLPPALERRLEIIRQTSSPAPSGSAARCRVIRLRREVSDGDYHRCSD